MSEKIYVLIACGSKTEMINGVSMTAEAIEIVKSFATAEAANEYLCTQNPDVAEPAKWGVHTICVYEVPLPE